MASIHKFELPAKVYCYRCGCGQEWAKSVNRRYAVALVGKFRRINPDGEGWFSCTECGREFRWAS